MSNEIPRRLQCIGPCDCQEFFSNVTQLQGPSHLQHLVCLACDHPWYSHLAPDVTATDPLFAHRRRGLPTKNCQGFYPLVRAVILSPQWNPKTLCVCNGEWKSHLSYHAGTPVESATAGSQVRTDPPVPTPVPLPAPAPAPAVPASLTKRIVGLPPPIAAIRSLATLQPEEANQLRLAAALHTLPQHQPVASHSKTKVKNRAKVTGANPTPNRLDCDIMICPNVGNPSHGPEDGYGYQQLCLHVDQTTNAYDKVFIPNWLFVHATFQPGDLLLTQVYNELKMAARLGKYTVPGLEEFDIHNEPIDYDSEFSWVFLSCKRDGPHYRFSPDPNLGPGPDRFNAIAILQMGCSFVPLRGNRGDRFFLVVAPRFGNITGPIEKLLEPESGVVEPEQDHDCFAYRVLYEAGHGFYRKHAIRGNNPLPAWPSRVTCLSTCPLGFEEEHANDSVLIEEVTTDLTPDGILRMTPGPRSSSWSPPPVETRATYNEVIHRSIYEAFKISGTSVPTVAKILWDWFLHTVDKPGSTFPQDDYAEVTVFTLTEPNFDMISLFHQFTWNHQFRVGEAIGPGPEHTSWQAALSLMVADPRYWHQRVSGRLIALALLHLTQGFVTSPWVVLALVGGVDAFGALTLDKIKAISLSDAATVSCWYDVDASTRLDTSYAKFDDLRALFADALSADVMEFAAPRSQAVHRGLLAQLNAHILLDDDIFWTHPDLDALCSGFDWCLSWDTSEGTSFLKVMQSFPRMPLMGRLYTPFIDINEVIERLRYEGPQLEELPMDVYQRSVVLLFRHRLEGYLRGSGHPPSARGELVTSTIFNQEKDDPLVCGRLLLDATWAVPRPPMQPHWSITFMYRFKSANEMVGTSLSLHTCTGEVNVVFTPELVSMLALPGNPDNHPSYGFFHGQCLRSVQQYSCV
ncbi:uncharacterized protein EV420DRAFT_1638772 [Desarmillaria tabescens]|uniref:Uncharacterized protein n=1 Tax=Armillaria tabescens TaxID=1929756 RepID=A0AA39NE52_ARMTA|nr:uncharacterized protein EV420DRAFT_1638772 [Desarmillaria tabescens]KAK0463849.1 hypothetical protein EV420DRAFT_1638772 [Desarmillaria tabescens]